MILKVFLARYINESCSLRTGHERAFLCVTLRFESDQIWADWKPFERVGWHAFKHRCPSLAISDCQCFCPQWDSGINTFLPFGPNWRKTFKTKRKLEDSKSQNHPPPFMCSTSILQALILLVFLSQHLAPWIKHRDESHLAAGVCFSHTLSRKSPDLCGETINTAGNLICAAASWIKT